MIREQYTNNCIICRDPCSGTACWECNKLVNELKMCRHCGKKLPRWKHKYCSDKCQRSDKKKAPK